MTNDLWFMSIIIVGILFCCGCYWAGVAYGKQEGRRIAKQTKHACQLEIERARRGNQTLEAIKTFPGYHHDNMIGSVSWFIEHAQRKAASHDSDAG